MTMELFEKVSVKYFITYLAEAGFDWAVAAESSGTGGAGAPSEGEFPWGGVGRSIQWKPSFQTAAGLLIAA